MVELGIGNQAKRATLNQEAARSVKVVAGLATVLICSFVNCLRPSWSGNRHPECPLVAHKLTCHDAAGMAAHDPKRTSGPSGFIHLVYSSEVDVRC